MRFMQPESVLQIKNRSGPAKNCFSVALLLKYMYIFIFSLLPKCSFPDFIALLLESGFLIKSVFPVEFAYMYAGVTK